MKATELLHRQHQMILQLLSALEGERYYRLPLLRDLRDQLAQHVADEAGGFANAVRSLGPRALATMRATHQRAHDGLARLSATCHDRDSFVAEVRALRAALVRLVAREEEEIFSRVEREWDADHLDALGEAISQKREPAVSDVRELRASSPGELRTTGTDGRNGTPRVPRQT